MGNLANQVLARANRAAPPAEGPGKRFQWDKGQGNKGQSQLQIERFGEDRAAECALDRVPVGSGLRRPLTPPECALQSESWTRLFWNDGQRRKPESRSVNTAPSGASGITYRTAGRAASGPRLAKLEQICDPPLIHSVNESLVARQDTMG